MQAPKNTPKNVFDSVDQTYFESLYLYCFQVKKDVGQVDILINNAGIVTGKKFLQCSDSMIQKTMEVNIMAHFWVSLVIIMLKRTVS